MAEWQWKAKRNLRFDSPKTGSKTIFASSESNFKEVLNSLKLQKLEFPIIVKPNIGLKGLGVVEIKNADELENYYKIVTMIFDSGKNKFQK